MSDVGLFLRETLELGYFAFFLPSRLQQRMDEWLPAEGVYVPLNTTPAEILTRWREPQACRFLAQCAVWWLLGLIPMWVVGWYNLPLWLLIALSLLLPLMLGWAWALVDLPSSLLGPVWAGLAWAVHPAVVSPLEQAFSNLAAALAPWLDWRTGGLALLGMLASGLVGSGLGCWLRRRTKKWSWVLTGVLLAPAVALAVVRVLASALAAGGTPMTDSSLNIGLNAAFVVALVVAVIMVGGDGLVVAAVVVGGVAGVVAGAVAGSVAAVVVVGVACIVAIGVAPSVVRATTYHVVNEDMTDVAVGGLVVVPIVAVGVAGVVAAEVVGGVAFVVAGVVATVVGIGVLVVLLVGSVAHAGDLVAGGVAGTLSMLIVAIVVLAAAAPAQAWPAWLLIAWGFSRRQLNLPPLALLVVLLAKVGFTQGWAAASFAFVVALAGELRLWSTLAATVAGTSAYVCGGRVSVLRLLGGVPPFSDEIVWTPVPFLDRLLARAFQENPVAGLEAIQTVAGSFRQGWAARRALAIVTRDTLQSYGNVEALAGVETAIIWLPADLKTLGREVNEMLPRFLRIGQSVASALASASPYNCRLGLRMAAEELCTLDLNLGLLVGRHAGRWRPVVAVWREVLQLELDQPLGQTAGETPNPYEAGSPLRVERAALFRGRQDLTEDIARTLLECGRTALMLYGNRRMGKTSLLQQLPRLLGGDTVPVFVDLQSIAATGTTGDFLYALVWAITNDTRVHRVDIPTLEREDFQCENPFALFEDWLQKHALPALQGRTLLLTLDEFEKLDQAIQRGEVDKRVLDEIRSLMQHQPQIAFLFAVGSTLADLGPGWSSYFIGARTLRVTYLRPEEAAELVRNPDPESGFDLVYDDAVVDDILALTRCHPYLVQLVCADVVREANARRTKRATGVLLEAAVERALESGEAYFRNVWHEMTGVEAASIAAGQALLHRLAEAASPILVPLKTANTATRCAVDRLVRLDVIEEVAGGYRFQVPLVSRWVATRAPMAQE